MLRSLLVKVVNVCIRRAWIVIALALLLSVASGFYVVRHFSIDTNVEKLISSHAPWRERDIALVKAFPQRGDTIVVVLDAPTPEQAELASRALTERLASQHELFLSASDPQDDPFFSRNGLLYLPTDQLAVVTGRLASTAPLVRALALDPSLRGLADTLSTGLDSLDGRPVSPDAFAPQTEAFTRAVDAVLAGHPASFSWQSLLGEHGAQQPAVENAGAPGRRFIVVRPHLDFSALEPGRAATEAIRKDAAELNLAGHDDATIRLTGEVPMSDDEFATLKHGAGTNALLTFAVVLVILWLALRSPKIIAAVFINLLVGLSITAALGLAMVGSLNLISVAFAVLFVGLGVDFGIQFSVRYREERYRSGDLRAALSGAAAHAGIPLTLAAAATAAGFLSFLPTDYRGVAELGQIAGVGMGVAYLTSLTLLPALIAVANPSGERAALGLAALAPLDRFLARHRRAVVSAMLIVVAAGLPLLANLRFDFNPVDLRSPKVESVATFLALRNDPALGANAVSVLTPSLQDASELARRLAALPEVGRVSTLENFVPAAQPLKLALIEQARAMLGPTFVPGADNVPLMPAPTDAEDAAALARAAQVMRSTIASALAAEASSRATGHEEPASAGHDPATNEAADPAVAAVSPGIRAAQRLADALARLAQADPGTRARARDALVAPLAMTLAQLRESLQAEPVSVQTLPPSITADWVTADGRARVEALPRGDPNDNATLRRFTDAVLKAEPSAAGGPISIMKAGDTVVAAFIQAGAWALGAITVLLFVALRRVRDVALTLVPLLLSGVLTLELCVLLGMPINFANIIALPVMLGVGVAFKIYYVVAWRAGQVNLLQSPLTRAVVLSAATTATAFGSLWFSSHPGMSSMGRLLALSLACTLVAAVLFQPALMGRPRNVAASRPGREPDRFAGDAAGARARGAAGDNDTRRTAQE